MYDCCSRQLPGVRISVKQGNAQKKHLCSANMASINKCLIKRLRGVVKKGDHTHVFVSRYLSFCQCQRNKLKKEKLYR